AARRWPRPALARQPRGAQRDFVGATHRRALGGPARTLSALPDLPSPVPSLGPQRRLTPSAGSPGQRLAPAWRTQLDGRLSGRHLRGRQKRGHGVGKTKRGKGTKLMAMADGAGLPLAVHVTSASPHEVTLVEPTLQARFIRPIPRRLIA